MRGGIVKAALAALVVTGCAPLPAPEPVAVCREQARVYGEDFRVAGSFATTVGRLRSISPMEPEPELWPELSNDAPAVACYLDGSVPGAPPGGDPYDRALVGVSGEHADLILAGYREELTVEAP